MKKLITAAIAATALALTGCAADPEQEFWDAFIASTNRAIKHEYEQYPNKEEYKQLIIADVYSYCDEMETNNISISFFRKVAVSNLGEDRGLLSVIDNIHILCPELER